MCYEGANYNRFIPARAGNTCAPTIAIAPHPVHPRTRGEHDDLLTPQRAPTGSSPHARGTPTQRYLGGLGGRFIPARAGNTERSEAPVMLRAVHPRTRGEHRMTDAAVSEANGSSPHARGTLLAELLAQGRDRFIPARAGNTSKKKKTCPSLAVHPRTRGEHSPSSTICPGIVGSSPHARGTRRCGLGRRGNVRFIPARAGNTELELIPSQREGVHPRTRGEHSSWKLLKRKQF